MIDNNCLNNSQMSIWYNVRIDQRDAKTRRLMKRVEGKNTVTKKALMGIIRLFNGEFVGNTLIEANNYVPKYLALGTNGRIQEDNLVRTYLGPADTVVNANDSSLHRELLDSNGNKTRIKLTQTNIAENNLSTDYVKLRIKCFISSDKYNGIKQSDGTYSGTIIEEAGLFTDSDNNSCWARYVMPTGTVIHKNDNSVIDITWEITVKSSSSAQYPSNINCLLDKNDNGEYVLSITRHKDKSGNIIEVPIDLYGIIELEPKGIVNMNTIYFISDDENIFSINNRGIGTVKNIGKTAITAKTVNNMSVRIIVTIKDEDGVSN